MSRFLLGSARAMPVSAGCEPARTYYRLYRPADSRAHNQPLTCGEPASSYRRVKNSRTKPIRHRRSQNLVKSFLTCNRRPTSGRARMDQAELAETPTRPAQTAKAV